MALTQPDFLPGLFAAEGNYQEIPDDDAQTGRMSWAQGFPVETSTPLSAGGTPPRRIDMNGLGNRLSEFLFYMQSGAMFSWSAELEYPLNAHVIGSDNREYVAIAASGPSESIGAVDPVADVNFTAWKPYVRNIVDIIYPVGSIYMSMGTVSPATLFGGTWQAISGSFLLASSSAYPVGSTGGSMSVKLTVQNLPAHNHTLTMTGAGQHNHTATTSQNGDHTHTRGTMEITGSFEMKDDTGILSAYVNTSGAMYSVNSGRSWRIRATSGNVGGTTLRFNASRAWTGNTSTAGNHNHTLTTTTVGNHTHACTIGNTGGNQAVNIMPPYLSVNVWRRTA